MYRGGGEEKHGTKKIWKKKKKFQSALLAHWASGQETTF